MIRIQNLSSQLLTKHITLPLYYRMFLFFIIYFLLIKFYNLNLEAFCMQENPSNEPPTWQSLYGEAKVRIADLQTRLRQESTNSNYLLERYENLERECMEWKDLASEHKENLDMLERENQRLQQEVQTLSRRICDFENIERAFSQTRK
jgi:hypothetical protein